MPTPQGTISQRPASPPKKMPPTLAKHPLNIESEATLQAPPHNTPPTTAARDTPNCPLICKRYFFLYKLIMPQSVELKMLVALNTPLSHIESKERARNKKYEL